MGKCFRANGKNIEKIKNLISSKQFKKEVIKKLKKHYKNFTKKKNVKEIETVMENNDIGKLNINVSSDSKLVGYFNTMFPQKKNYSLGKGENIMKIKFFNKNIYILNTVDEKGKPKIYIKDKNGNDYNLK